MDDKPKFIINIPTEFLPQFEINPSVGWQSFGSFAQHSNSPFFENISRIHDSVTNVINPFNDDTYSFDSTFVCNDKFYRFMHIDLGYNKDACGISMCHVSNWIEVKVTKFTEDSKAYVVREPRPVYTFDFIARIVAPVNEEIIFEDVREIIYEVNERGFPILLITYDGFQSIDSIQILRNRGFIVDRLSIDRTSTYPKINIEKKNNIERISTGGGKFSNLSAWSTFKEAINSNRINIPKYNPITDTGIDNYGEDSMSVDDYGNKLEYIKQITWIEKEMLEAMYDDKSVKVIEPPKGTIDLLESAVGAVFNASNNVLIEYVEETDMEKRIRVVKSIDYDNIFDQEDFENQESNVHDGNFYDDSEWES